MSGIIYCYSRKQFNTFHFNGFNEWYATEKSARDAFFSAAGYIYQGTFGSYMGKIQLSSAEKSWCSILGKPYPADKRRKNKKTPIKKNNIKKVKDSVVKEHDNCEEYDENDCRTIEEIDQEFFELFGVSSESESEAEEAELPMPIPEDCNRTGF
jgi:hypothetical protein